MDASTYALRQGRAPLLISLPHDGSEIPADIAARLRPAARRSPDTDWHVGRLYAPLAEALDASLLRPRWSRYVVDLNRPADGAALYPGRPETGLVSTLGFDGEPLYLDGAEPTSDEVQQRVNAYWQPYHQAISNELARLLALHGRVVLWEGHSIRARVPMLFEGRLPDLNLGTAGGASCETSLQGRLAEVLAAREDYSHVVNGRFQGGYITRHFGQPGQGVSAVQLELAQAIYMDEDSCAYDEEKAAALQHLLRELLQSCIA